jgi:hypothetical protein
LLGGLEIEFPIPAIDKGLVALIVGREYVGEIEATILFVEVEAQQGLTTLPVVAGTARQAPSLLAR